MNDGRARLMQCSINEGKTTKQDDGAMWAEPFMFVFVIWLFGLVWAGDTLEFSLTSTILMSFFHMGHPLWTPSAFTFKKTHARVCQLSRFWVWLLHRYVWIIYTRTFIVMYILLFTASRMFVIKPHTYIHWGFLVMMPQT